MTWTLSWWLTRNVVGVLVMKVPTAACPGCVVLAVRAGRDRARPPGRAQCRGSGRRPDNVLAEVGARRRGRRLDSS